MPAQGASREAATEGPPEAEVLRRRLRIALRNARVGAELTQKAAAERLDWSLSKVVRIEQGTVPVAPSDVRVMLTMFGVDDETRIEELVSVARQAREARSWSEYDDIISPTFKEMIGQEAVAASIWKYEPGVVPGYFQTNDYARALLSRLEADNIARRAELRNRRQLILEREPRPELFVIIGEIALVRPVGSDEIMREQLHALVDASRRPGVNLYLMPFTAGAHKGMGNAFTVLQFDEDDLDDTLYLRDAELQSTARDGRKEIDAYLDLFTSMREIAERAGGFEDQVEDILRTRYGGGA